MDVEALLRSSRHVTTGFHFLAGQAWRRAGEPSLQHSALVYAALEYRCALERLVLELYLLIAPDAASAPEKIRDFGALVSLVHKDAGNKRLLWRTLAFNEVYARVVMGLPFQMAVPDVGRLHRLWSGLSEYCHRQLSPNETWDNPEWVRAGYKEIAAVEEVLWGLVITQQRGWLRPQTMPVEMQEERARFLQSRDDLQVLERRLGIIKPVVQARLDRERAAT
jgi:hypothetical protein